MSVLIKGIEMPKTCGDCRFSVDGWCYAIASNDEQPGYIKPDERSKWCPLVPVPPHGRLIDADAVERNLVKMQMAQKGVVGHGIRKSRAVVRDMATVISADKDGE